MTTSNKQMELKAWHLLLEDDTYRLDLPDDFYQTLIRRADELVLREVITLQEWQRLKDTADAVYEKTLQSLSTLQRDRLDTVSIDLCISSEKP
ncbi:MULTISPECIES: hypothetical protein [Pseudomonas syringae group]|uniref:Uncharacterized protein n=1 Tax=Pseudomonas syringae pv. primulae TaxID=251707 RepID=A0A0P9YV56_9PSED|nr:MULTISPECIES: hypothetical protein [Pseudomonas syringae group]KPY40058.1 Uncharacterized protein ALO52_02605 [Pseudomonas syringae pv. primulae]MBD8186115.1 hypothetical protein [Pseudomonas viridiflava]MBD8201212.1 hypothetical protein [Pseudomonas viridiflava]TKJ69205.1 hypothetical protein PviCFBP13507_02275 [Pseudomonas viridiflava]TKK30790.1 hypothetical protein PviCFBP13515_06430 [Pseudomonas viridiflava]